MAQAQNGNKIVKCTTDGSNNLLTVSTELANDASNPKLLISSTTGDKEKTINLNKYTPTVSEDVSGLHKGVHVTTLYINDMPVDSKTWIKE